MYSYMIDIYGLPLDRTNVNGGAIALGHPLGCSESQPSPNFEGLNRLLVIESDKPHGLALTAGARQVATGLHEIRRRGGKVLVTSMCIGLGTSYLLPDD